MQQADKHGIRNEADRILKQRNKHQPWAAASAGCVFKNPLEGRSAGQLIDMAGLKGKCIGDAEVSTRHANFIINRGRATANDVLALIDLIQIHRVPNAFIFNSRQRSELLAKKKIKKPKKNYFRNSGAKRRAKIVATLGNVLKISSLVIVVALMSFAFVFGYDLLTQSTFFSASQNQCIGLQPLVAATDR